MLDVYAILSQLLVQLGFADAVRLEGSTELDLCDPQCFIRADIL